MRNRRQNQPWVGTVDRGFYRSVHASAKVAAISNASAHCRQLSPLCLNQFCCRCRRSHCPRRFGRCRLAINASSLLICICRRLFPIPLHLPVPPPLPVPLPLPTMLSLFRCRCGIKGGTLVCGVQWYRLWKRRRRKRARELRGGELKSAMIVTAARELGRRVEQSAMAVAMVEKEIIGGGLHTNGWRLVNELQRSLEEPVPCKGW